MPQLQVLLEDLLPLPVAVLRRAAQPAELSRLVPECCGLVWSAMREQGAKAGRHVAIYWDGTIRLEVGVEALGPFRELHGVVRSSTPGGPTAHVTFLGPYGGLGAAHAAVRAWSQAEGRRLVGPNWEVYGHWQEAWNADASQVRTDVYYQVAPA